MDIKRRRYARKKEIQLIKSRVVGRFPELAEKLSKKAKVELAQTSDNFFLVLLEGKPYFFELNGEYFPTLRGILETEVKEKFVVVDKGAVTHVVKGADVMLPGVVEHSNDFKKGEIVVVLEEQHRKPIALGIALLDAEEFDKKEKGKCVENLHYVGDKIWNIEV